MAIKRKIKEKKLKPLTELEFLVNSKRLTEQFKRLKAPLDEKMQILAQRFITGETDVLPGETWELKENDQGWQKIEVTAIVPEPNWEKMTVRLKAHGTLSGEEKEPAEGIAYIDQLIKKIAPTL